MHTTPMAAIEEVRAALEKFQQAYTRRAVEELDSFMELFAPEADIELIGTGGINPGEEEWCLNRVSIRQLVEDDWNYWGDVKLLIDQVRIRVEGSAAWLSCPGTVTRTVNPVQTYQNFLDSLPGLSGSKDHSAQDKVYRLAQNASSVLYQAQQGALYIWPFRFTAVLVRRAAQWRFHQVQFSFPTTQFPDVRRLALPA
ncbi:MAG: nuclear transport factor 2 family protein [Anaerolineaceae bacterium]